MTIFQQMKRNARYNLKKTWLKVIIQVEAALWALIALALIVQILR
jgi:L-alanine-DL-glutamate epimerase-like enolase superfamily enzyme